MQEYFFKHEHGQGLQTNSHHTSASMNNVLVRCVCRSDSQDCTVALVRFQFFQRLSFAVSASVRLSRDRRNGGPVANAAVTLHPCSVMCTANMS